MLREPMFDLNNPEILRWTNPDCGEEQWAPTPQWKCENILDCARRYDLRTFVETGTLAGDTVEYVRGYFDQVHSIELSPTYYGRSQQRFESAPNVHLYFGDSGEILKDVLSSLKTPILLYLDAHGSGGDTISGCDPLERELQTFFKSGTEGMVVIDDMQVSSPYALNIASEYGWNSENKFGVLMLTPRTR
jgi:hypothetical protein